MDIGNGNTKFGVIEPASPPLVESVFVPRLDLMGTGRVRDEVEGILNARGKGNDFPFFCRLLKERGEDLRTRIAEPTLRHPSLANPARKRVYLCGGAPYLIACHLAPAQMIDRSTVEVSFSSQQLKQMVKAILETERVDSPALAAASGPDRLRLEAFLRRVKDIHGDRNILIGLEILLAFDDALEWDKNDKELIFTNAGLVAWLIGFVAEERARTAPGSTRP